MTAHGRGSSDELLTLSLDEDCATTAEAEDFAELEAAFAGAAPGEAPIKSFNKSWSRLLVMGLSSRP